MKMTTDAGDKISLSEVIDGYRVSLQKRLDEAGKKPGTSGLREANALLDQMLKLSKQAKSVGYELDGSRQSAAVGPKLAELRATISRHEGGTR
jgi:hypothetical protein